MKRLDPVVGVSTLAVALTLAGAGVHAQRGARSSVNVSRGASVSRGDFNRNVNVNRSADVNRNVNVNNVNVNRNYNVNRDVDVNVDHRYGGWGYGCCYHPAATA